MTPTLEERVDDIAAFSLFPLDEIRAKALEHLRAVAEAATKAAYERAAEDCRRLALYYMANKPDRACCAKAAMLLHSRFKLGASAKIVDDAVKNIRALADGDSDG